VTQVAGRPIGFWSATLLGVGAMVGAGIFALLGEAATIAGSAVYLSFLCGGIIAGLAAYSLGRLGARFPAAGGIVEYLVQAFGPGLLSGGLSIVLYLAAVTSLALVAKAFGGYASALFFAQPDGVSINAFAVAIVLAFVAINLLGSGNVARVENVIVAAKLIALVLFAAAGLAFVHPALLAREGYASGEAVFASIGVTFFAYEGFRVITNTAEDMRDPARTLPRAMGAAVAIVMCLYVALAVAVFGNLPVARVIETRDHALAEAALPVFGTAGYLVVSCVALVSTASAINAGLFAATNVTYQLAKNGGLPAAFGRPIGRSHEGVVISGALIVGLMLLFDLKEIAMIGSITVLLVHGTVHFGHLTRLRRETGASAPILLLATVSCFSVIALVLIYEVRRNPDVPLYIVGFVAAAFGAEKVLQAVRNRLVRSRTPDADFPSSSA
jgi:amino acid transporter